MAKLTKKAASQLREYLAGQSPERLVDLVMAEVERRADLKDRLLLEIAQTGGPLDLAPFRQSFADALRSNSAVSRRSGYPRTSSAWAREVHASITRIGGLLAAGQAAAVIELTEYALGRVARAMSTIDDSSGWFSDIVTDLERIHHEACLVVRPDPVDLARRLFAFDVDGEWDIFIDSVERYADVLGGDGIAELRRLAGARWAEMPERRPGTGFERTPGRFHLERMMEKLAVHDGDVDARVAVMAHDLSHAKDFLEIAEVLAAADRPDDALEWAQRGLIAFADDPRGPDLRLDDFVLHAYRASDHADDLAALVWRRFDQRPTATAYARMRLWTHAVGRWDDLRPKALDRLRSDGERAAAETKSARATEPRGWGAESSIGSPYETLIDVLLHDGAADEAWQLATEYGCSQRLWMALAKVREADHPIDAVTVYQRQAEEFISWKRAHAYEAAVELIGHIVDLLLESGDDTAAPAYLDDLRRRHKPKTRFLGLLTESGL